MSAVLVTGATGFVGRAVETALTLRGEEVVGLPRSVDLDRTDDFAPYLSGVHSIVHCAARAHVLKEKSADPIAAFRRTNRDATLALAQAATKVGVRRFVFLSSIGVLGGETHGRPFRPEDPLAPHSDYAVAKAEAEKGLADIASLTGLELVVIRPPLVLGPHAKGNLGLLVSAMRRGLPLPLGAVRGNRRDLVSLHNLADMVSLCVRHPAAAGGIFHVTDGRALSTREVVIELALLEGLRPKLVPLPPTLLRILLKAAGRSALAAQLLNDLEVDMSATRERLGWTPSAP